jgi:hypothetical protein
MGSASYAASNNTAVGYNALLVATTGTGLTAIGNQALDANTTGINNTGVGSGAAGALTTGGGNTALGWTALNVATTANSCVAIGAQALNSLTTASYAVGVGHDAFTALTTGGDNTGVGLQVGATLTTGNGNTLIGGQSNVSATNSTKQNVFGVGVTSAGDNTTTVGYSTTDSAISNGGTTWSAPSDIRLKEDIQDEEIGLNFINDLRPVTFRWKKAKDVPSEMKAHVPDSEERVMNGKYNHGFIAQEVKEVIDRYDIKDGFDMWTEDEADGRQRIGEAALMPLMVKALQELSAEVKELKTKLENK